MKHGAYADDAVFVEVGPFGQSRGQVLDRRLEFLEEQDCQGIREAKVGSIMWVALEKLEFSDVWAAAVAAGLIESHPSVLRKQADARAAEQAEVAWGALVEIASTYFDGALDEWVRAEGPIDWQGHAEQLRIALVPGAQLPGRWDDKHTPVDDAGWRDVVELILDEVASDPPSARVAIDGHRLRAGLEAESRERELKALVAPLLLRCESDLERPQAHLWRCYATAARELEKLQARRRAREPNE